DPDRRSLTRPRDAIGRGVEFGVRGRGQVLARVELELLEEHALGRDLGPGLTIRRAGHGDGHGQGCSVAGQTDHADVVAEVLPAELGADADLLGELEDLLLEFDVTEAPPGDVALAGELV